MLLIPCPHCGPCPQIEFSYGGDAAIVRPAVPADATDDTWNTYLYLRDNSRGPHDERWHHMAGCRRWIVVRRNVLTHVFEGSEPPS